ncbi:S-layer homology domain-containing protein [Clostridium phoceensis]|uniref:S-layer homology domain-containing protein n=1 Tax=Clostridium phoceensis TaxID=1650661 RepID=UPI002E77E7B6|nr:S-layer homology domain-containing protein [Clostridium phoceensis]
MRNLKRALSLALASVMLLGMMVVGSSAKGIDDFTDKAEIVNQDAVAVTSAIGMFEGYEDGSFGPENVVTRAEMAVIICTMLYGAGVNVNQFAETSVFTDVPDWAEGYVNLCASLGIVAGVGDGKFDPSATVTTAQAVLMLCRTLGYFRSATDFGNDWMLAATAKGTELGMYGDLKLTANSGLTRDNVAELVFNALTKAVTVEYNDTFNIYFNTGSTWANGVTFDYKQTLGYKNFSLVYMTGEDDFNRPCTVWGTGSLDNADLDDDGNIAKDYDGVADDDIIIRLANDADYTYTAKVSSETLYNDVGRTAAQDYIWTVYVDGEEANDANTELNDGNLYKNRNSSACFMENAGESDAVTGNGVLTQVYVDTDEKEVTVSIINTYVAEVYRVDEDDDTITLSDLYDGPADASDDEFSTTAFSEDDVVLYTYADDEIQSVVLAESVEGTVTRVQDTDSFSLDGTSYSYAFQMPSNDKLTTSDVDAETVAYVDSYGYVIYLDADAVVKDYAYVSGVGDSSDKYGDDSEFGATLVLADGTKLKVDLDPDSTEDYADLEAAEEDLLNFIVSYSEDSDGLYALDPVGKKLTNAKELNIESGTASMDIFDRNDYSANSSTVFILYDGDDYTVYTGIKNVPDVAGNEQTKVAVYDKSGVARVMYIENADVEGDDEVIFVIGDTGADDIRDNDTNTTYREYDAVVGGEVVAMQVKKNSDAFKLIDALGDEVGVYSGLTRNSDEFVTSLTEMDDTYSSTDYYYQVAVGTEAEDDETVGFGGKTYAYDEDVVVARYDGDDLSKSTIGRIRDDGNDEVYFVLDGRVLMGVLIVENEGTDAPDTVTVKVEDSQGGYTETVNAGEGVTLGYTAPEGYTITAATVNGTSVLKDGKIVLTAAQVGNEDGATVTVNVTLAAVTAGITVVGNAKADVDQVDVNKATDVTVEANEGYTITDVNCDQATKTKANSDGTWTVTIPAGAENVVIKVETEAVEYAVTYDTTNAWFDDRLMIKTTGPDFIKRDGSIKVELTTDYIGATNAQVKVTGATGEFTKVNGVDQETDTTKISTNAELKVLQNQFGTIYSDADCKTPVSGSINGQTDVYWITVKGQAAVWTGTISNPTGNVTVELDV